MACVFVLQSDGLEVTGMYPGASLWLLLPSLLLALSPCRAADPGSWGDWVILDEAEPGTSILLRRITPKSVFVAPTFSCSEGYRQDALGRCIKHVKVNQAEQWKFYLDRLNSMYAPASSSKKPQKEAGPFHISLPIGADNTQEDVVVKKRLPPVIRDQIMKVATSTSTTQAGTTTPQPATTNTYPPPTTVQESTTPEPTQPTGVDTTEGTSTERESDSQPETTTDPRRKYELAELDESAVMLGDQPLSPENSTPKNPPQPTDKPFVIIVTSEPAAVTEESALVPVTAFTPPAAEREGEEVNRESAAPTEVTTEATTEQTSRYTTDSTEPTSRYTTEATTEQTSRFTTDSTEPTSRYTTDSTEYDERFSEVRDTTAATERLSSSSSARPPCDPRAADYDDCEPAETEVVTHKRVVVTYPSSMPLQEPHTRVRFPSESYPSRQPQQPSQNQYVRFPERSHPHDDRPSLWWPSWQVRSHPAIRGWPPPETNDPADMLHKQYPPYPLSWSDTPSTAPAWRRRYFQRD